ncbi:MAG: glycosyltransferase family 4 protein [Myxococcales bacterium]|nr:glycosyltransferase family 4 protein [Myxococcales bacterium]
MKIVYLHTDPLPSPMAGSVFALSTAVGLAKAGHETVLIMPRNRRTVAEALEYYGVKPPENLRILLPAPPAIELGSWRIAYSRRFFRAAFKLLQTEAVGADGIIVRTLTLAQYLSRHELPAPLVYEMHDWYADIERKWSGAEWMIDGKKLRRERFLQAVEKETIPRLAGVIALRRATGELMRQCYPAARVEVVPTGLDAPAALPAVSAEPVVVYAGQLHKHKGLQLLFEALKLAPDLRAIIVGGGDPLADLKAEAARLGVEARVEFTGHVPAAAVREHLSRGRVGVLPMRDCFFNRVLTSPLKIMEYYAAGLPVVTVDAPVTREVVEPEQTGLLAPFDDPAALAGAMRRLCLDGELHARCRARIEQLLPDLSWTRRGERIGRFLTELASPRPG